MRETREELGLKIMVDDLIFIGTLPLINAWPKPPEPELHFIYSCQVKNDLQTDFSDQEVTAIDWYDIDEIIQAAHGGNLKLAKADSPLFVFALSAIKRLQVAPE